MNTVMLVSIAAVGTVIAILVVGILLERADCKEAKEAQAKAEADLASLEAMAQAAVTLNEATIDAQKAAREVLDEVQKLDGKDKFDRIMRGLSE